MPIQATNKVLARYLAPPTPTVLFCLHRGLSVTLCGTCYTEKSRLGFVAIHAGFLVNSAVILKTMRALLSSNLGPNL